MSEIRPTVDSCEGFTLAEQIAYFEQVEVEPTQADLEAAEVPSDEDYEEMDDMFSMMDMQDTLDDECEDDGQPSEYDEWQDYMGGDDWDHGQYDE